MRKFLLVILAGIVLSACNTKEKRSERKTNEPKVYSNEFFSLEYPSDWDYEEEINDMADTIPAMSKGIRATFYKNNPYAPFHTVMVQKSTMFECFETPEEWRDLSVQMKQFSPEYIGTVDNLMLDSIQFGPYPAAMAGFVVITEDGDTLIHKQMVVMDGHDLYYLNNSYDWNDDGTLQKKGDSILSTFRIKKSSQDQ